MATKSKPVDAPAEPAAPAVPETAADAVPQAGGCYVRQPDGQIEPTAPDTAPDTTTE